MLTTEAAIDLMQRAKAGEKEAFALLYENFYTPIFRFVYAKVSDRQLAEDLTQTVFMKAFAASKNFSDDTRAPLAYFFTIARNLLTDHYRKPKEVNIVSDSDDNQDFFEAQPSEELTPDQQVEAKQKTAQLKEVIGQLKPEYQEILELKFFHELSNKEIADRTGKTEANIRQIQVRALRKVREFILT